MTARKQTAALLAVALERRLALPVDQWEPVGELSEVTGEARARLAELPRNR